MAKCNIFVLTSAERVNLLWAGSSLLSLATKQAAALSVAHTSQRHCSWPDSCYIRAAEDCSEVQSKKGSRSPPESNRAPEDGPGLNFEPIRTSCTSRYTRGPFLTSTVILAPCGSFPRCVAIFRAVRRPSRRRRSLSSSHDTKTTTLDGFATALCTIQCTEPRDKPLMAVQLQCSNTNTNPPLSAQTCFCLEMPGQTEAMQQLRALQGVRTSRGSHRKGWFLTSTQTADFWLAQEQAPGADSHS